MIPIPHGSLWKISSSLRVQTRSISVVAQHGSLSLCLPPAPEHDLPLEKTNRNISVREGEEVTLPCLLRGTLSPGTHLSATWFRGTESSRAMPLLTLHRDGAIEYPQESLAGRLQLRRPTTGDLSLTLRSTEKGDAGEYHCQVQEWPQQSKGKDSTVQALARSGYTRLTTIPTGNAAGYEGLLTPHPFPLGCAGVPGGGIMAALRW